MEETPTYIPYNWVKESMKKANKKYRKVHRETYNLAQKKYYNARKNDEEYMQKMRIKAHEYYHRKKAEKLKLKEESASVL